MHVGADTDFYLRKGFRVVAVEANPILAQQGAERFAADISDGRLSILNIGVAEEEGSLPFYINEDNDEWSSFDKDLGTREQTRFRLENVRTVRPESLLREHGMPYFMKVDIEGLDWLLVDALHRFSTRPRYMSIEDNGFESLLQLHEVGAKQYQFVDQVEKWRTPPPKPALEGRYAEAQFGAATSGLFGRELPGDWMRIDQAALFYLHNVRSPDQGLIGNWWDIHASF